jgi:hypothetical protein
MMAADLHIFDMHWWLLLLLLLLQTMNPSWFAMLEQPSDDVNVYSRQHHLNDMPVPAR